MVKIPPSERIKQEIEELLQGQETSRHPLDNFKENTSYLWPGQ